MVVDMDGPHADRRAREKDVARAQGDELRDMRNKLVDGEKHVATVALLHLFAVQQKVEREFLHVFKPAFRQKAAHHSGPVKSFGYFPRLALLDALPLKITGGEIHSQSNLLIVIMGELLRNTLSQPIDFHYNFGFIMHLLGKIGQEEGTVASSDGRVGLQEENRLLGSRLVQLGSMCRIVPSDADEFHD